MINEFQSHQGKSQFKIQSFLQARMFQAKKLNNSFLFYNTRMITLLNNGMLVYYSKCFKSSQQNTEIIQSKPKYGVYFNNVLHSCVKISEQEVELIVKFKKSQLYNFDDFQQSYVKEPRSQDIILWIFTIRLEELLQKQGCDIFKVSDSLNSLYNCQMNCFEENTQKSNYQQAITEKTSSEHRKNTTDFKRKKKVQWLDNFPQKQMKETKTSQIIFEYRQNSKQIDYDNQWEINEEKSDLEFKKTQIKSLYYNINGFNKNIK